MQKALNAAVWTPEDTERILQVRAEIHAIDRDERLRAEGKAELINIMLKEGVDVNEVARLTHLSLQEIEMLRSYKFN